MKKLFLFLLVFVFSLALISCGDNSDKDINPLLNLDDKIVLKVVGGDDTYKAIDVLGKDFNDKYPNCTVYFESIQDYNINLEIRLEENTDVIDLFFINKSDIDKGFSKYAYNLFEGGDYFDLSDTHEGLVNNFITKDENDNKFLYAIPTGAEIRGMVVNKTLLAQYGLSVPTTLSEMMNVCAVMKENNKVPFLASPGEFAQTIIYPYICNIICNTGVYEDNMNLVNSASDELVSLFDAPMQVLYNIMINRYFDYMGTREYYNNDKVDGDFSFIFRAFLNILINDQNEFEKVDGTGSAAFTTCTLADMYQLDKIAEEYGTNIEYEFILSPVSEQGGFAYLSPGKGIAVNKNSEDVNWALEFLDFIFKKENNEKFASNNNRIPNTEEAFDYLKRTFDLPKNQVSHVGQATFDYNLWGIIKTEFNKISKGNNAKYMDNTDPENLQFYSLEYYKNVFKEALAVQRNK